MDVCVNINGIELETERLLIRPWITSDLNDFFEYASVCGVGEMAGWNHHKNIEESREILEIFINEHKTFALELKDNNKVIGSVGIERIDPLIDPYENMYGKEIGYVLSKDYWGRGLMTEAVKRVIDFCFDDLSLDYLWISHWIENCRSRRVIEKCGFDFVKDYKHTCLNGDIRPSKGYQKLNRRRQNNENRTRI